MTQTKLDVIGFGNDDMAYGIPTQDRIHMAIFGEVGSGKSETMKLLIAQNLSNSYQRTIKNKDRKIMCISTHLLSLSCE